MMRYQNRYRMPAEWERQSMVQLTWPHKDTDWAPMLEEITETYVQMAREIAKREPLLIVVPSHNDLPREVLEMENTTVFECPTNDTWARDHGFLTIVRSERAGVTAKGLSETSGAPGHSTLDTPFRGLGGQPRTARKKNEGTRNVFVHKNSFFSTSNSTAGARSSRLRRTMPSTDGCGIAEYYPRPPIPPTKTTTISYWKAAP